MVKRERAGSAKEPEITNSPSVICSHLSSSMAVKCDHGGIPTSDGGPTRDLPNSSHIFSGRFPEGLSVLVLDEDQTYLQVLEKDLLAFRYQVSVCNEEERAMDLLRNHKNRFDIAIIEAQNSKGDLRFGLISKIGLEMDLPIIIMSKDDSVESVVNGMLSGACDYLIKPIRNEDLRMIFKHVAKKMQGRRSVDAGKAEEKAPRATEKSSSVGDSAIRNPNKRKRGNEEDHDGDGDRDHVSTSKKRRVVWDDDLHKKFLAAVEQIGLDNAVPKKILELMNDPTISRENVASHLQKFRMNLKKQNEQKDKEKNISSTTQQDGKMYGGEEGMDFYKGEVQFPTYHINNIPQPCVQQQHIMNTNITTQPLGHHHLGDGVSVAVFGRNLVMTHHHQQTSELSCMESTEDSFGYNDFGMHNEDEAAVGNLTCLFMQNSHEVDLLQCHEPMMATTSMIPNHHHPSASLEVKVHATEPSMLHLPSFPSYPHSSFLDQQDILTMADESGVFNYDSAYSVDNKNNNKFT